MKKIITILGLVILMLNSYAQERLSIEKCRELALQYSKELNIAILHKRMAIADNKAYKTNYLPKISASGQYLYASKPIEADIDFTIENELLAAFIPKIDVSIPLEIYLDGVTFVNLNIEQPIYTGGKIKTTNQMSKLAVKIASENISKKKADAIALIDMIYWQYVYYVEKYSLSKDYYKMLLKYSEKITKKSQSKSKLLKVQIKTNQAELELQKVAKNMNLLHLTLCKYIGVDHNSPIFFKDTAISINKESNIYEIETNANKRSEYIIAHKQMVLSKMAVKLANSDFLPQVGVSVRGTYFNGIKINDYKINTGSVVAIASVKIPIFHWGEGKQKVQSARIENEIANIKLQKKREQIELEINSAKLNLQQAYNFYKLCNKNITQAKQNVNETKLAFTNNTESYENVIEAIELWNEVNNSYIKSKLDCKVKELILMKAMEILHLLD